MNAWEKLRRAEVDSLVTAVKLEGSALVLDGVTTPEGWPFVIVVAVGKPGNERAVELAREFHRQMAAAGAPVTAARNPEAQKST